MLDELVDTKMDDYMESMNSVMKNKHDHSNKKLDRIQKRNQYVDDVHNNMMNKFNEDSTNAYISHEKDEQKKHKKLKQYHKYLSKEWN